MDFAVLRKRAKQSAQNPPLYIKYRIAKEKLFALAIVYVMNQKCTMYNYIYTYIWIIILFTSLLLSRPFFHRVLWWTRPSHMHREQILTWLYGKCTHVRGKRWSKFITPAHHAMYQRLKVNILINSHIFLVHICNPLAAFDSNSHTHDDMYEIYLYAW